MSELNKRLSFIQAKFKTKKSRYNSFGKYYFRSAEDILEAIKPYLSEYNLTVTIKERFIETGPVPIIESTAIISDGTDVIHATAIVGVDLNQKGMQTSQQFGAASTYGKKYALGNLLLIDDTADSDATNTHGKAASVIERVTKPAITAVQLLKAQDYMKAGGDINAIKTKYKLTAAEEKTLNGKKANITKA